MIDDELIEWRNHPVHKGYKISSGGRIFGRRGRELKGYINNDGYQMVGICQARQQPKMLMRQVHRLVLETFIGHRPEHFQCAHLDGVKTNNRLNNLLWTTSRDNNLMKHRHGTMAQGEKNGFAKLTADDVELIRATPSGYGAMKKLAQQMHCNESTIHRIRNRLRWRHV